MANGVLDYKRYLATLQANTDIGQTFPSTQQKYTFTVEGGATNSWTASLEAITLIVDQVSYDRNTKEPNFSNSEVIGYFEGTSTATQITSGVIYLPNGVYTGPILPGGNVNVPVTVYNLTWANNSETFSHQLGFVQNWEPGVEIGNPYDAYDFEPIDPIASTFTLRNSTNLDRIIYEDPLILIAQTDIPIELGTANPVKFYKIVGGNEIYLGQSFFVGQEATFVIQTNPDLPVGSYQFVAKTGGRRQYGRQTSNTLNIAVLDGIPLLISSSIFVPSKAYYFPNDSVKHTLSVYPDPAFTATGYEVTSTTTVSLIDGFPPNTTYIVEIDKFKNGINTSTFVTSATMVDTALTYRNSFTNYSITTSQVTTSRYTATLFVYNTETVRTEWGSLPLAKYARGTYDAYINVANTTTITVIAQAFPISIVQNTGTTYIDEEFTITVNQTTATYYQPISIFAKKGASTETLFIGTNSGVNSWTTSVIISSSGTYSIFASFPGDSGSSIFNSNLPSTSNTLTHVVILGNELLPPPVFTYWTTATGDNLQVWASTSTTLTNTVSFYDGATLLGTATWFRNVITVFGPVEVSPALTYNPKTFFDQMPGAPVGIPVLIQNQAGVLPSQNPQAQPINLYENNFKNIGYVNNSPAGNGWASPDDDAFPVNRWNTSPNAYLWDDLKPVFPRWPNKYSLFKYYDGSNYDLTKVGINSTNSNIAAVITGTNVKEIIDPIEFGTTWNSRLVFVGTFTDGSPRYNLDAWREDTIGDSRGYNVIGLAFSTTTNRPIVSESIPQSINWTGVSGKQRSISLVEFIGTATWRAPSSTGASTQRVWLYRFTPEIPQANSSDFTTQFAPGVFDNRPGRKDKFRSVYPPDYAFYTVGQARYPFYAATFNDYQINYGKKRWISLNAADPIQNDLASFYNDWFYQVTNPGAYVTSATFINTTTVVNFPNTQTAYLSLPLGTITSTTNLRAVWQGTTNFPIEFGKFLGFNIPLSTNPSEVSFTLTNITALGYNIGDTTATSELTTTTNIVYNSHKHNFTTRISINLDQYPNGINTGTVKFLKSNGQLISQQPLIDSTATLILDAMTLTNSLGQSNQSIKVEFTTTLFTGTSSSIYNLQSIQYSTGSPITITNYPFGSTEFQVFSNSTSTKISQFVTPIVEDINYPYRKIVNRFLVARRSFNWASTASTITPVNAVLGPYITITMPPLISGRKYWKIGANYNLIYPNNTAYFLAVVYYSFNGGVTMNPMTLLHSPVSTGPLEAGRPPLSSTMISPFNGAFENSYIWRVNTNQRGPTTYNIGNPRELSGGRTQELVFQNNEIYTELGGKTIEIYLDLFLYSPLPDTAYLPIPLQENSKIHVYGYVDGILNVPGYTFLNWF